MSYNTINNKDFYQSLLNFEIAGIKAHKTGITRGQISAAKARATKAFLKAEKEYWAAK